MLITVEMFPNSASTCSSPGVDTTSSSQSFASRSLPHLPTSSYLRLDNPQLECVSVLPTAEPTDRNVSPTTHSLVSLSQISPTRSAPAPSSLWPSRPVTPSAAQQEVRLVVSHTPVPGSPRELFPYTSFSFLGSYGRELQEGDFHSSFRFEF